MFPSRSVRYDGVVQGLKYSLRHCGQDAFGEHLIGKELLQTGVSLFQFLGTFAGFGVILGPVLVEPAEPSSFCDLQFRDDLDHRPAFVDHFLSLTDFSDVMA